MAPRRIQRWGLRVLLPVAGLLRRRGAAAPRPEELRRLDFPTQTRRMGLRMTERLRDRLRSRWLRLR